MKALIRLSVVAAVAFAFSAGSDADARCCFLKKLFDRGNDCCCEPDPCGCEVVSDCGCAAPADCGCGAPADCGCGAPVASDCGCGSSEPMMYDTYEGGGEPTEASPADDMPSVPEPPANGGGDTPPAPPEADAAA